VKSGFVNQLTADEISPNRQWILITG